ncbi:hypothetical protein TNCV_2650511 [Trichonephila clavipes]|nr:hypothetical protein TNCV_2650511 [Trichonephila clavipes]
MRIHNLLVYVALSRVMAEEGLHVPTDGRQRFSHSRRNNEAMLPVQNEFTRLSAVHLTTIDQIMINKMDGEGIIIFSLNCQSIHAHALCLSPGTTKDPPYRGTDTRQICRYSKSFRWSMIEESGASADVLSSLDRE